MAYTTIKKPSDYFNTVTWTGTGDATTTVSGVSFQPDFTWIKNRNVADDHMLFDAVRGVTKRLFSNSTGAEGTDAQTLTSFDSDGFTTGNNRATGGDAGNGMVSWNWLASNTTASNTDGSITSTVSANTTSGFSIVSYTGNGSSTGSNVVGHGLGTTPSMIIIKARAGTNAVNGWYIFHKGLSANNNIRFDTGSQLTTSSFSSGIINTSPTSTTFGFDSGTSLLNINESGTTYIAYCFAEKKGFSKFGSYIGNGSTDGPFIYTGFKPAFLILKRADSTSQWKIIDNKRLGYNPSNSDLYADSSEVENATTQIDLLSNGFKIKVTSAALNSSGGSYIYMAFAEEPLVGDNPATAR